MKAEDLRLEDLLRADRPGVLRFAGGRALLLEASALGLLRRELIETLGEPGARGVLTRFGYAHGWQTAVRLEKGFAWDGPGEWRKAGGVLHTIQGLVRAEGLAGQGALGRSFAEGLWHDSYEAEQHLLHVGPSAKPVCWTLVGFASGYLSCCNDRPIVAVEVSCVGRGDAVCQVAARPREDWGDAIAEEQAFLDGDGMARALRESRDELRRTDRALRRQRARLARADRDALDPSGLVARSPSMRAALDFARRVGRVDSTVVVTGESGVGKERVTRLIHACSRRAAKPMLAINCGALSETLVESELFGHEAGAFTGATSARVGLIEAASGGTLFLDEIGEIPPSTQVKLLRVLQEREVRRLGSNRSRSVDVRILAATNRDLAAEVRSGRFREDLWFRLKVLELRIPSLRDRREDILPLARVLLAATGTRLSIRSEGFTPAAADALVGYRWPGNVRELENAIERALVVATGPRIERSDLPIELRAPPAPTSLAPSPPGAPGRKLADVERQHILATLRARSGSRRAAADALGIGVATLYRKLKRYRAEGWETR